MLKYYTIVFPGEFGQHVQETWSSDQIIKSYYPYWTSMMIQNVAAPDLNPESCIADWCATHWATETDQWGRKIYTDCDCGCNIPVASTPQKMLEFLAHRMQDAGVGDAVAQIYARDIRKVLKDHYGVEV